MREEIQEWKVIFEKEIKTRKAIQFIYGALVQFDALN